MAYEVVKEIRGHRYRYSVESRRDPQTGKVRNRWTYLGRAEPKADESPKRRGGGETRERLIDAFLRLIEREDLQNVTASAIAREAGLASATFYRHFRTRDELIAFCTERAFHELDTRLAELRTIAPTESEERDRIREFAARLVRDPGAPPGLYRAWSAISVETIREARHAHRIAAFSAYIEELRRRGYAKAAGDVRRLAIALSTIVQMLTRRTYIENQLLSEEDYGAVGDVFERLLFFVDPLACSS